MGKIKDMGDFNELGVFEWNLRFTIMLDAYDTIQLQVLHSLLSHILLDSSKDDVIQWVHSVDKVYTVAEGVRVMLSNNLDSEFDWMNVVGVNIGGVPVKELLSYRHCLRDETDDKCGWCGDYVESIDHLLLHCSWSFKVWRALFNWWNISWTMPSSILEFSSDWCYGMGIKVGRFWRLISPATIWSIWNARNELVFNASYICWAVTVNRIKAKVFQWLVNTKLCEAHQFYVWNSAPYMLL
ncbi:uncharacterized protein [Rutidosis leptorrhynchoides]|uniref:uncharacterized protein n=1 Tax=Rutidosis leptorrhynchoides TaxID=125765 RepID=UPI003A9996FD